MKKRNLFISMFLLVSILFLGIGYAALTNNLTINGSLSATKNDENLNVEFVAVTKAAKEPDGTESTAFTIGATVSGHTATISVQNMSILDQQAIVTFTVQNNSAIDLDSLDAILGSNFTIKLGEGSVTGTNYTITSESTDTNDAANIFRGEHFLVSVAYSKPEDLSPEEEAKWGTIKNDGSVELDVTQKINVVVTIQLKEIVSDTLPLHILKISFIASTVTE